MLAAQCQRADSVIRHTTGSAELRGTPVAECINPFIAVVLEIGVKVMEVKSRTVPEFVVERTAKAIAAAFIAIFSQVHAVVIRNREAGIGLGLDVPNATPVIVVAAGKQRAKALL